MKKPLRVATAGTGYFSQFHYNAWQELRDEGLIELIAICNRTASTGEEFAVRYGIPAVYGDFETMLAEVKPDLVDVITPPVTHLAYVRAAVDKGVAVICQKPFTPNLEQAESLMREVKKKGTVVIHENFRFQPWYPKLKTLIEEGAIGEPYQVSFWLRPGDGQGPEAYLSRQPYFQQMERFLVHETAIHLIDTFRFLFGEIRSVYSELVKLNPVIAGEDSGIILFDFENGRRGLFDGNRLVDHKADNRRLTMGEMSIEGSGGSLRLIEVVRTFIDQSHRFRMLTLRLRPKPVDSNRDHQAVLEAIENGDAEAARRLHREHRERSGRMLISLVKEHGLSQI